MKRLNKRERRKRLVLTLAFVTLGLLLLGSQAPTKADYEPIKQETQLNTTKERKVVISDKIVAKKAPKKAPAPARTRTVSSPAPTKATGSIFVITGYSTSAEEGTADGITADGTHVRRGVCAADIRVLPFGTRIYISGYGECVIHDTGGAIIGNRIDAYFPSRQEAFAWGRRTLEVKIYR